MATVFVSDPLGFEGKVTPLSRQRANSSLFSTNDVPGTVLGTVHTELITSHFTEFKAERLTEVKALSLPSPAESHTISLKLRA